MHIHKHKFKFIIFASLLTVFISSYTFANATSANISKSYQTASSTLNGDVVSIQANKNNYVVPANTGNDKRLLGVVVKSNESLLAIDTSSNTVQVAITGAASTLVSTVNGNINIGDEVSVSPFDGIGMKEAPGYRVVGIAQTAFNNNSTSVTQESIKDKNGVAHNVSVGFITLTVDIGSGEGTGAGGNQPNILQRLVKDITGRTIPTARIIISLIVAIIALLTLITMIYASIHGSIISVGRNPLAKKAIYRTLTIVFFMALITVSVACTTIYFLLK